MKYKKILTWACTAALFLTGCTTDTASNGRWMEDSNAVRIQASAGSTLTRSNPIATDESKQTGFNQGDMISVRNRNITVNYTLNGEIWQPEDNDKYLVWDKNDLKFEAYYPCDGKNTFSVGYIKKDQRTLEDLAKSDYMNITYNVSKAPSDKHLTLKLERKTARLILKIQKFNDEFSEGVKVTELGIDCPENTNGEGSWESIRPYQQNGDGGVGTTYTALVIPGKRTVYITPTNTNTSEPGIEDLKVETGELKAGKSYTYNLIVGKNKVTVGGVTVAPWNTENTLQGGEAKEEDLTPYVTMTAASNQTFVMKCTEGYTLPDLEYSVNNEPWQKVVADNPVEFGGADSSLRLRGKCPNGTATDYQNYSWINFGNSNVKVKCSGDIRTLIDYTAYKTVATASSCFCSLFNGCSVLTSAPQLPAKALKESCYRQMFEGCTSLEQAPDLPATELQDLCYHSMFKGCKALTQAPVLQATALKKQCYRQMFEGCTSLTQAPVLPATELQETCYFSMFKGCTALTQAPNLSAIKLKDHCYQSMFEGCTALTQAPMLSAKELGSYCYNNMFKGCTSLKKAPELPATTLQTSCYSYMFANCEKLIETPVLNAIEMANNSYQSMFAGCTSLVNAPALPATTLNKYCYQKMFSGCTSLKKAPELGAKKLTDWCYQLMFENCTNLESVTMLATEYGYNPLSGWLNGAGTKAKNRTLKVSSKDFYTSKIAGNNPDEWKIGANNFKVFDQNNNEIK